MTQVVDGGSQAASSESSWRLIAGEAIEPGDGATLNKLLNRFCPATDIDSDLIRAAFLTPAWGGSPGTRPAFVITSDNGRGAGKSTLAELIGELFGGVLSFSYNEEIKSIKTRLLSKEALTRRVALLDNVKSLRFSWADLEGLITASLFGTTGGDPPESGQPGG